MNVNYKKSLKLVTLLIASLLIATVSASVYYSLSMTSTVTVAANQIYFVEGADNATAGVTLSGTLNATATLSSLKAYANATTTYDDPIEVRNNATSGSTNIRLRHVSLTGAATQFVFINFTLKDGSTIKGSLNYTSNGSAWSIPSDTTFAAISANSQWKITIETKAVDGATSASVTIAIAVDVQQ